MIEPIIFKSFSFQVRNLKFGTLDLKVYSSIIKEEKKEKDI